MGSDFTENIALFSSVLNMDYDVIVRVLYLPKLRRGIQSRMQSGEHELTKVH